MKNEILFYVFVGVFYSSIVVYLEYGGIRIKNICFNYENETREKIKVESIEIYIYVRERERNSGIMVGARVFSSKTLNRSSYSSKIHSTLSLWRIRFLRRKGEEERKFEKFGILRRAINALGKLKDPVSRRGWWEGVDKGNVLTRICLYQISVP